MIIEATNRSVWIKKLKTGWNGFGDSKLLFDTTMESALILLHYLDECHFKNIEIKPTLSGEVIFEFLYGNHFFIVTVHDNDTYTLEKIFKPSWTDLRFVENSDTSKITIDRNILFADICNRIKKTTLVLESDE